MEEQHTADEQSHYEISLTAAQAFVAFVLLLLSLAASFAFGLMLGKGQADERLVVRKDNPVVTEASFAPQTNTGEIVDVAADEFTDTDAVSGDDGTADAPVAAPPEVSSAPVVTEEVAESQTPAATTDSVVAAQAPAEPPVATPPQPRKPHEQPSAGAPAVKASTERVPHFAQLLSTGDQKVAEGLAVKLINRGYTTAYVERGASDKGNVYRVRVRFDSEAAARTAEPKLREFSKDVWITSR